MHTYSVPIEIDKHKKYKYIQLQKAFVRKYSSVQNKRVCWNKRVGKYFSFLQLEKKHVGGEISKFTIYIRNDFFFKRNKRAATLINWYT